MHFSIQPFQLSPKLWFLSIASDKPNVENHVCSQLPYMADAFRQNGFDAHNHYFFGLNLTMIIDKTLKEIRDETDEDILILFPHLRLVIHTTWDHLEESLNPHFHPTKIYSQAQLLYGQGLFKHHELLIILLHILAASHLAIDEKLKSLHHLHQQVDLAISSVW